MRRRLSPQKDETFERMLGAGLISKERTGLKVHSTEAILTEEKNNV